EAANLPEVHVVQFLEEPRALARGEPRQEVRHLKCLSTRSARRQRVASSLLSRRWRCSTAPPATPCLGLRLSDPYETKVDVVSSELAQPSDEPVRIGAWLGRKRGHAGGVTSGSD